MASNSIRKQEDDDLLFLLSGPDLKQSGQESSFLKRHKGAE